MLDLSLTEHFRGFAAVVEHDGCTTYATICRGVAEDEDVLGLLEAAPPEQQRPLLLLASVHSLLLSGIDHPLAAYYDTVATMRGLPPSPPTTDVASVFRSFCLDHRDELNELLATRRTQTNEVGRCTALLPGLCHIASLHPGEPVSLLDLGTSAGLNLLFDDYHYTYRSANGDASIEAGAPGAAVSLACTARPDVTHLPELRVPEIAARVGLDLEPIDPFSDETADWLLACQWPDNPARFARLRAALDNVRASSHPPRLVQGDMVEDLPEVAASVGGGPLVIFHTWVAAYLDEDQQSALVESVAALGVDRPVHHLYAESASETSALPTPPPPVPREGPDLATALVHIGPGGVPPVRLADMHPHGTWLRWWPTRPGPKAHPAAPGPARPPR